MRLQLRLQVCDRFLLDTRPLDPFDRHQLRILFLPLLRARTRRRLRGAYARATRPPTPLILDQPICSTFSPQSLGRPSARTTQLMMRTTEHHSLCPKQLPHWL
jgi:hypothetical protein